MAVGTHAEQERLASSDPIGAQSATALVHWRRSQPTDHDHGHVRHRLVHGPTTRHVALLRLGSTSRRPPLSVVLTSASHFVFAFAAQRKIKLQQNHSGKDKTFDDAVPADLQRRLHALVKPAEDISGRP
jgi:hypothetical protein